MILESLRHLFSSCPRPLKRLGVLHDLIALDHRARRQQRAWAPHQEACRQAIEAMSAGFATTPGQRVIVLGSGLLLEIPLSVLAARFREVVCVDLFHLPSVRRQAQRFGVRLEALDITGVIDCLPRDLPQGILPDPSLWLPDLCDDTPDHPADLILSANCLSQLSGVPLAAADAVGGFRPDQLAAWERAFVQSHLQELQRLAGLPQVRVGLIADSRRECLAVSDQRLVDERDLLCGGTLPPLQDAQSWWWDLAPAPEESRRWSVRHRVHSGLVQAAPTD